jgi:hypothetical protein
MMKLDMNGVIAMAMRGTAARGVGMKIGPMEQPDV